MQNENFWAIYFPIILIVLIALTSYIILRCKGKYPIKHNCWNGIPIVIIYRSFNYRDVIYQCKCGKRYLVKDMDATYLFNTTNLQTISPSTKEIERIINCEDSEYINYLINSSKRTL